MFNIRLYLYLIILFAIAFFLTIGVANAANITPQASSQVVPHSNSNNNTSLIGGLLGGGLLGGGGVAFGKAFNGLLNNQLQTGSLSGIQQQHQHYTNSPQYIKDKITILEKNMDKLIRRYDYSQREIIRHLPKYRSYEEYRNPKSTN